MRLRGEGLACARERERERERECDEEAPAAGAEIRPSARHGGRARRPSKAGRAGTFSRCGSGKRARAAPLLAHPRPPLRCPLAPSSSPAPRVVAHPSHPLPPLPRRRPPRAGLFSGPRRLPQLPPPPPRPHLRARGRAACASARRMATPRPTDRGGALHAAAATLLLPCRRRWARVSRRPCPSRVERENAPPPTRPPWGLPGGGGAAAPTAACADLALVCLTWSSWTTSERRFWLHARRGRCRRRLSLIVGSA